MQRKPDACTLHVDCELRLDHRLDLFLLGMAKVGAYVLCTPSWWPEPSLGASSERDVCRYL
jgi:hypothetical protein